MRNFTVRLSYFLASRLLSCLPIVIPFVLKKVKYLKKFEMIYKKKALGNRQSFISVRTYNVHADCFFWISTSAKMIRATFKKYQTVPVN